jgi:putative FmdB family regulatory protein
MPIYEYLCSKCHELSDALQKVNDPAPEVCPNCGAKQTLARQVSRTSFVLKGGGWYSDLYGSSKEKKPEAAKPEAKSESKDGAGAAASSDGSGSGSASTAGSSTSSSSSSSGSGGGGGSGDGGGSKVAAAGGKS